MLGVLRKCGLGRDWGGAGLGAHRSGGCCYWCVCKGRRWGTGMQDVMTPYGVAAQSADSLCEQCYGYLAPALQ